MGLNTLGTALQGPNGVPFGLTNTNNALDVVLNDSVTPTIINKMNRVTNSTTLTVGITHDPSVLEYDIEVASTTGVSLGSYIILFSVDLIRYSVFSVIAINSLVLTLDTPIDASYPIGTVVDIATTNMAVNGSVTPVIFGLRGTNIPPGIAITAHVTRLVITCFTDGIGDLGDFGDISGGVLRGLVFRRRDGNTYNIFNVKTNGELAGITLDFDPYAATNPQQGINGFVSRLTFSGQDKLSVVLKLELGDDIEIIIQDDLSSLTSLEIIAEGSLASLGQV